MTAVVLGLFDIGLPLIGVIVLVVLISLHRRGGARATGVVGAVLIAIGLVVPAVVGMLGFGLDAISPDAVMEAAQRNGAVDLVIAAVPGVLTGAGLILVAVALFRGRAPSHV